jgi:hypothetical protein
MSEPIHDPQLKAVEAALTRLSPPPPALDRDRLMFQAGQASRPPRSVLWPASTAALAVVCVGLATALVLRPGPHEVIIVKEVLVPSPNPQAPASAADNYVSHQAWTEYQHLQEQVLRHGLDGLPEPTPDAASPRPDPLDDLLGVPGVGWPRPNRSGT